MTPAETARQFQRLEQLINQQLPQFIQERIAMAAVAKISQRVIHQGKNAMGTRFSAYSTRPFFTTGYTEKSKRVYTALAGSKNKRKQLDWITVKAGGRNIAMFKVPGGYKEVRRIEGLQTSYKDFFFTGQMWRGFGVKRKQRTRTEIIITLGGRNQRSQDLIDKNSKRERTNIVNISNKEIEELALMIDKEIQRYVNKLGLR